MTKELRVYIEIRIIVLADNEKIKDLNRDLLRRIFEKGVNGIITSVSDEELEKCALYGKTEEEANEFFVARPNLSSEKKRKELEYQNQVEQQKILAEQQVK